jgi:hypothetical protein
MPDLDPLRPAFQDLRTAVLPTIRPPGVAAARQALRQRRTVRSIAVAAAAVAALVGVIGAGLPAHRPPPPEIEPTTSAPEPVIPPSPPPSVPGPSPSPQASLTPTAGRPASTQPAGAGRPTPASTCTPQGLVDVLDAKERSVGVSARYDGRLPGQLCPGERVRVFWASYTVEAGDVLRLYRSQEYFLDLNMPVARLDVTVARECSAAYFVVYGNAPVLGTISNPDPAGDQSQPPYANRKLVWQFLDPCPTPGPG